MTTTCPTCHHAAHVDTCLVAVRSGTWCGPCGCYTTLRHEIAGPADTSAVLARVKCPECGHVVKHHAEIRESRISGCVGCCHENEFTHPTCGCRLLRQHILAAHIAALEERLSALEAQRAADEALLRNAGRDLRLAEQTAERVTDSLRFGETAAAIDRRLSGKEEEE